MTFNDEFRLATYKLLLELDASTTSMMLLVSSRDTAGIDWALAVQRHHDACEVWNSFLNQPVPKANI